MFSKLFFLNQDKPMKSNSLLFNDYLLQQISLFIIEDKEHHPFIDNEKLRDYMYKTLFI